ncbi:MAG: carbohydrate kinase family protein, partial [Sulfobacillus sp.]
MLDVLVLGDSAWDTVVRIAEPLRFNGDIGAAIHGSPGGQGLNAATAARQEGATVGLITQVGTDGQSDALL